MEIVSTNDNEWDEESEVHYELCLFVNGTSPHSLRAIKNLKLLLEEHLPGKYNLKIVDAHQQPLLVESENVTAVPMLIKKLPAPQKRLIGDMSDTYRVLKGLGLAD